MKRCYEYHIKGGEVMAKQIEGVYDKLIECAKADLLCSLLPLLQTIPL